MKRLMAALVVAFFACVTPAISDHFQSETERLVRWTGCRAPVVTSDLHDVLESFYALDEEGNRMVAIGTAPAPWAIWFMVTLHESSHCLQHQEGGDLWITWVRADPRVWELDADRRSAAMACALGHDGRALLRVVFEWVHAKYGYEGDPNHGTLAQRTSAGDGECRVEPQQA